MKPLIFILFALINSCGIGQKTEGETERSLNSKYDTKYRGCTYKRNGTLMACHKLVGGYHFKKGACAESGGNLVSECPDKKVYCKKVISDQGARKDYMLYYVRRLCRQ